MWRLDTIFSKKNNSDHENFSFKQELTEHDIFSSCSSLSDRVKKFIAVDTQIDKIFEYWKERNEKISLLADKSPTHFEYLKEKIYNQT